MRGTLNRSWINSSGYGIIPAYAGNTHKRAAQSVHAWDHPRVCGEHFFMRLTVASSPGSSPRMRGTLVDWKFEFDSAGIIPAYAGNTKVEYKNDGGERDHPRVCGEHSARLSGSGRSSGSSPRMRGTLAPGRNKWCPVGIIPAYAGNTLKKSQFRIP